ncbi:MAG: hypothetical protein WD273_08340 [Trueperaceae bacterium]
MGPWPPRALGILFGVLSWTAFGQAVLPGLTVEVLTPVIEAQPRQALNLRVRFVNDSESWQSVEPHLTVPGGWQLLVPADELTLEPGASQLVLLTILVPTDARAGSHTFPLTYYSSIDTEPGKVLFTVTVPVVDHAEINLLDAPELVATPEYETTFLLKNLGNTPHEWELAAQSSLGLEVTVSPELVVLAPGEAAELTVMTRVPENLSSQQVNHLSVTARSRNLPSVVVGGSSRSTLVPQALPASAALHTFPLTVRASYSGGTGAETSAQPTLDISGAGWLSESGDGRFQVQLRLNPEDLVETLLLEYQQPGLIVLVGDQGFKTSHLTPDVKGFGVTTRFTTQVAELPFDGTLHLFSSDSNIGMGTSLSLQASSSTRLELMVNGSGRGLLGSFAIRYRPQLVDPSRLRLTNVAATYGIRVAEEDLGHSLEANWQLNEGPSFVRFGVNAADAGFTGRAGHAFSVGLESSLRMNEALRILPQYPLNLTLNYSSNWGWSASRPFFNLPPNGAEGHIVKYGVGANFGAGPIILSAAYSTVLNFHDTYSGQADTLSGLIRYQTQSFTVAQSAAWVRSRADGLSVGETLEYESTMVLSTAAEGSFTASLTGKHDLRSGPEEVAFGARWSGAASAGLDMSLGGQLFLVHPTSLWNTNVGIEHKFSNDHEVDAKVKVAQSLEGLFSVAFDLSYSVPFNMPIGRRWDIGEVAGSVVGSNGTPVPGLVLTVAGQGATTRSDGSFDFPAVPVGEHIVQLLPHEILGPTQILTPSPPRRVRVENGQVTRVEFKIVEGAALVGELNVRVPEPTPGLAHQAVSTDEVAQGVHIELRGSGGVLRTFTDSRGAFRFNRLLPGEWTLRVIESSVPGIYQFEPAALQLTILEGETAHAVVTMVPVVRRIQFDSGGETLVPPSNP